MAVTQYYGTGRRKTAIARVFLRTGSGKFVVNDKPVDEFFSRETGRNAQGVKLMSLNGGVLGSLSGVEAAKGTAKAASSRTPNDASTSVLIGAGCSILKLAQKAPWRGE